MANIINYGFIFIGLIFGVYILARVSSLAIFKSFSQVFRGNAILINKGKE